MVESVQTSYHPPVRRPAYETLEKILAAAEDQLREQELDDFTVQSVLQRSGLSVGAFYSRFPDKTALLHELQERTHSRVDSQILTELATLTGNTESLEDAVDRGFGVLVRNVLGERGLFRAFMMTSVFDPVMRQRGEQFNWARKRAVAQLLAPHRAEIGYPDPDLAIEAAFAIYSSTMRGRLVYYESAAAEQSGVTDDTLFTDLRRSLALFLRGPVAGAEATAGEAGAGMTGEAGAAGGAGTTGAAGAGRAAERGRRE
jgi:AcrR family transcriptional regulator